MNPETEAILKQMGFVLESTTPDRESGMLSYFIPRTNFHIHIYPKAAPDSLLKAIWNAGGEAKRKEIAKAHQNWLATLSN